MPEVQTRRVGQGGLGALDGVHALALLVRQTFPDDERMWRHVVWAESIGDWNPNWECTVYGGCWSVTGDCGLMQIHWSAHYDKFIRRGWTEADCFNPVKNLEIARIIYDTQGPGAWTTY